MTRNTGFRRTVVAVVACGFVLGARVTCEGSMIPRKTADVVVMTTSGTPCPFGPSGSTVLDTRILPDGSQGPLVVPSGQVLVVTDMDWSTYALGLDEGATVNLMLYRSDGFGNAIVRTGGVGGGGPPVENASNSGNVSLATPIPVVGTLCLQLVKSTSLTAPVTGTLRGFLTKYTPPVVPSTTTTTLVP